MTKKIGYQYRSIKFISIIALVIVALPISAFVWQFWNSDVSAVQSDWGSFGDYFGGVLNPIISLFSLILLGYLTYLVSKQSIRETEKLNFRMKRIDAFNEFSKHLSSIENIIIIVQDVIRVQQFHLDNITPEVLEKDGYVNRTIENHNWIENLTLTTNKVTDYYLFMKSFNIRFGFLFEKELAKDDSIKLINSLHQLQKLARSISANYSLMGFSLDKDVELFGIAHEDLQKIAAEYETYTKLVVDFINDLRDELK